MSSPALILTRRILSLIHTLYDHTRLRRKEQAVNISTANLRGTEVRPRKRRSQKTPTARVGFNGQLGRFPHIPSAMARERAVANRSDDNGHCHCLWVCRIDGRTVGVVGMCRDGLDGAQIGLFRVDPEWRHTSVPHKLMECVRTHAQRHDLTRIVAGSQAVPRWVLESLGHHGLRLAGRRTVRGTELWEFAVERDPPPAELLRRQPTFRLDGHPTNWA